MASGNLLVWEPIENAYRLEFTDQRALIKNLVNEDDPVQEVAIDDLSKAVEAWIEALKEADF